MIRAHVTERKILLAFRRLFGRRLAAMQELKDAPEQLRAEALQSLGKSRRDLIRYRSNHPELIGPEAKQLSLVKELACRH